MLFTPKDKIFLIQYLRENTAFIKGRLDKKPGLDSVSIHASVVLNLINDGRIDIDHRLLDIKNIMNLISLEKNPRTDDDIKAIGIVDAVFDELRQGQIKLYEPLDFLSEKDEVTIAEYTEQTKKRDAILKEKTQSLLGPHKTSSSHSSEFIRRPGESASSSSMSSSSSSSSSGDLDRLERSMDNSSQEPCPEVSIEIDPATPLLDEEEHPTMQDLLYKEWDYYIKEIEKPGKRNDENIEAFNFFEKMKDKSSYSIKDLKQIRIQIGINSRNSSFSSAVLAYTKNQTDILSQITSLLAKHKRPSKFSNIPFFSTFDDESKPPLAKPAPVLKKPG